MLNSGNTEQALALPACYVKFPFKDASYYLAVATHLHSRVIQLKQGVVEVAGN